MPAYPQFGGTQWLPELDLGQTGGTRQAANAARLTVTVGAGSDEAASVEHTLPQQGLTLRDNLGFRGATHTWNVTLRAADAATMDAMLAEISQRKTGMLRNGTTGELGPMNPAMIGSTKLTDGAGRVLSDQAVLVDWRPRGRRMKSDEWAAIQQGTLTFRALR